MTTPPWSPSGAPSNRNWSIGAPSKLAAKLAKPSSTSSKASITGAVSTAPSSIYARLTLNAKPISNVPHNFCVRFFEASPLKPYTRHILGIDSGVQSYPKATLKPHQGHTKATPKPHQGHTKATPKPHQGHTKTTPRPLSSHLIRPVCKSEAQKPPVSAGPWPQ